MTIDLSELSPMLREKIARVVRDLAVAEDASMTQDLAHWLTKPEDALPGSARQQMDGWHAATRQVGRAATEILIKCRQSKSLTPT